MRAFLPLVLTMSFAPLASAKMNHRDVMCGMSQVFTFTSTLSALQERLAAKMAIVNDPQVCPDATKDRALIIQFEESSYPYIILRGDEDVDAGIDLLIKSGQVSKQ